MSGFSLVLFDAGGTLLRPRPSVGERYALLAARFGASLQQALVDADLSAHFAGRADDLTPSGLETSEAVELACWRAFTDRLYGRMQGIRATRQEWFDAAWADFARADAWALYPDVLPALEGLRSAGVRAGVLSNWDSRLDLVLRELGLSPYLARIEVSSRAGVRKPDPRIFLRALEALGVSAGEAAHVGDSWTDDVRGARAAGVLPIFLVRDGAGRVGGESDVAIVSSLLEVVALARGAAPSASSRGKRDREKA
ncbi:MAG: HAD-IA family hydrolase [Planctomycetes bacterium]|nr:HAD-IA family hydrolase [Planctomycetota bacterium]